MDAANALREVQRMGTSLTSIGQLAETLAQRAGEVAGQLSSDHSEVAKLTDAAKAYAKAALTTERYTSALQELQQNFERVVCLAT